MAIDFSNQGANTREASKARLAAIKAAQARGSLGPFANAPQPPDKQKLSPLNPSSFARQSASTLKERKTETEALSKED